MHVISHSAAVSRAAARGRCVCPSSGAGQARPQRASVAVRDSQGGKQSKSVDDVLAAANALLDNLAAGGVGTGSFSLQASIDELSEMGYVCDESGCVLVSLADREQASGPPALSRMLSGKNWSLGTLPDKDNSDSDEDDAGGSPFTALVAGPCWSVPLKPSELRDFLDMLGQLRSMVANLAGQGQWTGGSSEGRPASRVKWETNHIVMQASYAPAEPGFSIEMTFRTDRRSVTTQWPAEVAAAVLAAVDGEAGAVPAAPSSSSNISSSVQRTTAAATV